MRSTRTPFRSRGGCFESGIPAGARALLRDGDHANALREGRGRRGSAGTRVRCAPEPRDGAPARGAMERKGRVAGIGAARPRRTRSSHVRGGEPLHAVRERGRGGEHVGHAGGSRGRVPPRRGDARRPARARRPAFRRGAREAPSETPGASATRGARKSRSRAGCRWTAASTSSARARRQNPRGASRDTRSSCRSCSGRSRSSACVDATRVSGHPSRRQIFSATASPALLRERTPVGTKKERRRRRAARPGGTTLTDHPTFRLALRALEWTPALGSRDPGAWFRSHAHPLARDGPSAPLGADLAKVGRRLLVPARVPTPDSVRGLGVHVWPIGRGG